MEAAMQKATLKAKPSNSNVSFVRFKDNQYSAEALARQSSSGPMIEIGSDELHDNFISMVTTAPGLSPELMSRAPVFAKYEGKYVVLLGQQTVAAIAAKLGVGESAKLKGRLLSNPMLKRCIA